MSYLPCSAIHRLTDDLFAVPKPAVVVSSFLPVGPCGQIAFSLLQLAVVTRRLLAESGVGLGGATNFALEEMATMTHAVYGVSVVFALFFWVSHGSLHERTGTDVT